MELGTIDLVWELDDPLRRRDPELEVELELVDEMLLDPWFQRSEAEIALLADDPDARVYEIFIAAHADAFDLV